MKNQTGKILAIIGLTLGILGYSGILIPPRANASIGSILSGQICEPDNSTNGSAYNLGRCINNIYIFAISIGSFIAVLMFVIAGYYYIIGTTESVKQGNSVMGSTLLGLVILFGTYLLLNTIDPNLTQIQSISAPDVNCQSQDSGFYSPGCNPLGELNPNITNPFNATSNSISTTKASQLLNDSNVTLSGNNDCPNNGPQQNLQAVANGNLAQKDGPGTACNTGTTGLSAIMLSALQAMSNANMGFTITSLASGHHSSATDPHYSGLAVDLVPAGVSNTSDASAEMKYINFLYQQTAQTVAVECDKPGQQHTYAPISQNGSDTTGCIGQPGYHIHAQWSQ